MMTANLGVALAMEVSNAITNETGVNNITFTTITDYLVLIVYILKHLNVTKTELKKLIADYEENVERLRNNVPVNIFSKIIHTDNNTKIAALKTFVKV